MQFLLYCLCGGMGVATDFAVYYLAIDLRVPYQLANLSGYVCGTLMSFVLNRAITFGVKDKVASRLFSFLAVAAGGFTLSAIMLWGLVDLGRIDEKIAKLLTLPVVVVFQFVLNRRLTFDVARSEATPASASPLVGRRPS